MKIVSRFLTRIPAVAAVCSAILLALAGGCGSGGNHSNPTPTPTTPAATLPVIGDGRVVQQTDGWVNNNTAYVQPTKKWTILVYMNGANDLEEFGSLNVSQMEQIGSSTDTNIVVQFKRIDGHDTSNGDWKNTRRYFVRKDNEASTVSSYLLSHNDSCDMGLAQTMQDFVQWGIATYPAQRYALFVWNHGAGWRSVKTPATTRATGSNGIVWNGRGVSYDDQTGNHIDTIQLPAAASLGNGRKWDVLAFDSSLMQMAEVSYEMRNTASYIVGSEESPPGEGYPYQTFLGNLAANPDKSTRDFALDIAQQTLTYYTGEASENNITQSVLDTSKLASLAPALDNLGRALLAAKGTYGTTIARERDAQAEAYDYPQNKDLVDFMNLLLTPATEKNGGTTPPAVLDPGVQAAITQTRNVLSEAILLSVHGTEHPYSNGLAIFLPSPLEYTRIDVSQANGFGQRYSLLSLSKDAPNWQAFLVNGPQ